VLLCVGAASLFYGTLAPSLKTYVTLTRPGKTEHSIAWILLSQSTGWLIGSYGAGWLLESGLGPGLRIALWGCGVLVAVHMGLCAFWLADIRRQVPPPRERRGWFAGLIADLKSLYENPRLLRLCVLAFLFVSANYTMWGFFTVYMVEGLGASMHTLRNALAASSILGMSALLFAGPVVRRFGGRRVLAVALSCYLAMYVGIGLTSSPVVVAILYALPLYGLVNVSANTLASEYSTTGQRGGGLGVLNGTYALAAIAGPVTAGLLADHFSLAITPWVSVAFMAGATPIAWLLAASSTRRALLEEISVDAG
jgi:predicted MFS family arabinose efflux permease